MQGRVTQVSPSNIEWQGKRGVSGVSSHGARGLQSALVLRVVALSTFSLQKHRCNEPGQDYYVYACTAGFPRENIDQQDLCEITVKTGCNEARETVSPKTNRFILRIRKSSRTESEVKPRRLGFSCDGSSAGFVRLSRQKREREHLNLKGNLSLRTPSPSLPPFSSSSFSKTATRHQRNDRRVLL